jgi:mannan endo-1,4-beta-mannosidase
VTRILALLLALSSACLSAPLVYEAEDGALKGKAAVERAHPGFSGSGYVSNLKAGGDGVQVKVLAPAAGMYRVGVRYSAPYGEKTNDLVVNEAVQAQLVFRERKDFATLDAGSVYLNQGENRVGLMKNWGWMEVDRFTFEPAGLPALTVPAQLCNASATAGARALFQVLREGYGKEVLSGATDAQAVFEITKTWPALQGFDLMDFTPSRMAFGAKADDLARALRWHQDGGLVQFQWHWGSPSGLVNGGPGEEWFKGFYTKATRFDLQEALDHPEGRDYQLLISDMDLIAGHLKTLRDAGVPVLWRPLHEAQGRWFWWGAKGAEPCLRLYKLMWERFTQVHHLDNLVWVWTTTDNPSALDWYPGDAMVDVVGADIYLNGGDTSPCTTTFWNLVKLFGGRKLVTLSETGTLPDPEQMMTQGAAWSWFMIWGDRVSDRTQNLREHVRTVFSHPYVVNRADYARRYAAALEQQRP